MVRKRGCRRAGPRWVAAAGVTFCARQSAPGGISREERGSVGRRKGNEKIKKINKKSGPTFGGGMEGLQKWRVREGFGAVCKMEASLEVLL
jgi:hypothetical protein